MRPGSSVDLPVFELETVGVFLKVLETSLCVCDYKVKI